MRSLVAVACLCLYASTHADDEVDFTKFSVNRLERMIYSRGLTCNNCSTPELRQIVKDNFVRRFPCAGP